MPVLRSCLIDQSTASEFDDPQLQGFFLARVTSKLVSLLPSFKRQTTAS